jgi:hypothetical protein
MNEMVVLAAPLAESTDRLVLDIIGISFAVIGIIGLALSAYWIWKYNHRGRR